MLPGHPYRVVVALLNICRWGVGCHAQTGRECQSYDPRDKRKIITDFAHNFGCFNLWAEVLKEGGFDVDDIIQYRPKRTVVPSAEGSKRTCSIPRLQRSSVRGDAVENSTVREEEKVPEPLVTRVANVVCSVLSSFI